MFGRPPASFMNSGEPEPRNPSKRAKGLPHVKESYQGETLDIVNFTISDELGRKKQYHINDPIYRIFTEFFPLFQSFKKKANKQNWCGYLPTLEFLEISKWTPWQKLLGPRIQPIPKTINDVKRLIDQNVLRQWQTRWKTKRSITS